MVKLTGPFSLHSVLDKTPYDDTETEKSRDFIAVQLKILSWLDKNAAVDLRPATARKWTELLIPNHQTATPQQALQLCYYMRKIGFNTFARLDDNELSLYIAEWHEYERNSQWDVAYWQQDIKTGAVKEALQGRTQPGNRRRGAISGPTARVMINRGRTEPGASIGVSDNRTAAPIFGAENTAPLPQVHRAEPYDPENPLIGMGDRDAVDIFGPVVWETDDENE
ncbi:hypothetical protein BDV96DRAFT_100206 [Lophiotrema nucula]|uniref:Uncharacterized protein n=1 Tax=Lophiotrema nucula TaxID=690887 RepID=A0A6A5Z6U5_9PLEO|nr:hypothetical protein BDV96DRAFT_100206 [Lophiotrema nucula]